MSVHSGERRYRIGVICDTPSIQLSAQYDTLAELSEFEFVMLLRSPKHINPAWAPRPPTRTRFEVLDQLPLLPRRARPFLNVHVARVLDRHNFDAMIVHGIYDNAAVWKSIWWCKRRHRPYLLRCDGNIKKELEKPGRRRIRRALARRNIEGAAALLSIGTQNCKYYEFLGADEQKMFMAPWEIDYTELESHLVATRPKREDLRAALGVGEGVVISSIGRLTPLKAFQDAIDAVAKLVTSGWPATLLIAGDGPFRARLEALARALPAGAVRLLGNLTRHEIVELLVASDVFVMPSRAEAWGLVINEAALAGLPIVATDAVGAGPDLIVPGRNGFIYAAGAVDQLYEVLLPLVEQREMRESMGRASRAVLDEWRQRFPMKEGYRQALHRALEPQPRRSPVSPRALKVLITGSTPGLGLAFQFVQLAVWLKHQGVDAIMTGCDGEATPGLFDTLRQAEVPFVDVPGLRRTGMPQLLRPSGALSRVYDELRPDVALVTTVGHAAESRGRRRGDPWVVWWLQSVRNTKFYAPLARKLAAHSVNRHSDQVWTQCEIERREMLSAGVREDLMRLVPTPIDVGWWRRAAEDAMPGEFAAVAAAKAEGHPILVYPASLLPAKRHDTLLRAAAIVKERFPNLFICCPGRYSAAPLRPLMHSLGLDGRVMFTESLIRQEAIPPLLQAADVHVFPSESETYGKALIEAFCIGVPTVCTRVGVGLEAEQAGVALVCDIGDFRAMAQNILSVLESSPRAEEMRRKSREWIDRCYSFEAAGAKMIGLLRELADRRRDE